MTGKRTLVREDQDDPNDPQCARCGYAASWHPHEYQTGDRERSRCSAAVPPVDAGRAQDDDRRVIADFRAAVESGGDAVAVELWAARRILDMLNERSSAGADAAPVFDECGDCDGCGWNEGGAALVTECATCNGTGRVSRSVPPVDAETRHD